MDESRFVKIAFSTAPAPRVAVNACNGGRRLSQVFARMGILLLVGLAVNSAAAPSTTPRFYPGVSEYQSIKAHEALRAFYNGNMPRADRLLRDLDAHEDAEHLPPLSRLLLTAMHGLTLQRDDAGISNEAEEVRAAFDSAATKGLRACAERVPKPPEKLRGDNSRGDATCMLIEGGIRGFRAILDLNTRSPGDVLSEGLNAVSLLEKAIETDSLVRDAHLGLGIFNAMAASNTPRVVRGMLRAAGRGVSLDAGLAHLRRSGYEGQYTSVASQFFLIRFLSPYDDELRREKSEIFRSLRVTFPLSPFILFLKNQEALVFYPDSFYQPRARINLARRIRAVEAKDYAGERYVVLLKHQYGLLDSTPDPMYRPDTTFALGGYAFYPDFVKALKVRREILASDKLEPEEKSAGKVTPANGLSAAERREKVKYVANARAQLLSRLRKTPRSLLNPQNRGLLEWHVSDALRPDQFILKLETVPEEGSEKNRRR